MNSKDVSDRVESLQQSIQRVTAMDESVSYWIQEIQNGNDDAARVIWDRYFNRLLAVAASNHAVACVPALPGN